MAAEDYLADPEIRGRIRQRTEDVAVSLWYTYNQHFKAANSYSYLGIAISISTATLGGVLTYGLIWRSIPNQIMIVLAILTAIIQAIRAGVRPSHKAIKLRDSAHDYMNLYEDTCDFLALQVDRQKTDLDDLETNYSEFNNKRQQLNRENPDVSSFWYYYVKYTKGAEGITETFASNSERAQLFSRK